MIDYDIYRVGGDASLVVACELHGRRVDLAQQHGPAVAAVAGRVER